MVDKPQIDFERAATLMDVVARVANVSPAYLAISSVAMSELKEMNEECISYLNAVAKEEAVSKQAAQVALRAEHDEANATSPKIYNPDEESDSTTVARRV